MKLNTLMVECIHQRSKELLLGSANTVCGHHKAIREPYWVNNWLDKALKITSLLKLDEIVGLMRCWRACSSIVALPVENSLECCCRLCL